NQLRCLAVGSTPMVIIVDDAGEVRLLDCGSATALAKPVCLSNDVSTWGIAACASRPLVAVSANSRKITVWDQQGQIRGHSRLVLSGHRHNIPCIDIDPSGQFLCSVSIDTTLKVPYCS